MKQKKVVGQAEKKNTEETVFNPDDWNKIFSLTWNVTRLSTFLKEVRDFGKSAIPAKKLSNFSYSDLPKINALLRSGNLPYRFYLTIPTCKMWFQGTIITRVVRTS